MDKQAPVTLSVRQLSLDGKKLVFEYQLDNRSESPVYAFAALYTTDSSGAPTVGGDVVYSFLSPTGVVEFRKALLNVPPWAVVEAPEVPFLVRVEKGQTYKETVQIPVPLHCHDPYDSNYPAGYEPARQEAAGWKFSLGVLFDDPERPVVRAVSVGGHSLFAVGYEDGLKRQTVVTSDVVPNKLVVLEPARTHERALVGPPTR